MPLDLHLPTLFLITIGINLLLGGFLLGICRLRAGQRCFRYWGWSCLVFALGTASAVARELVDWPWLTIGFAHLLLMLSPLLIVGGIRAFLNQRPWHRRSRPLLALVAVAAVTIVGLGLDPDIARFVTAAATAIVFVHAFRLLGRVRLASALPTALLRGFLAIHAALMLLQVGLMGWAWSGAPGLVASHLMELILVSHILLTTCTALSFPLLAFVQSEQRLRRLADYDELTGVYNRRAFLKRAAVLFEQARIGKAPFTVLMIDLDHFKQINDTWGHGVGDRVLQVVGRLLSRELREEDIVGRMGGEELAVALLGVSEDQAQAVTQRLRACIEQEGSVVDGVPVALSASIGGVHRSPRHDRLSSMLADADSALYAAKGQGRNQVFFQIPLPAQPAAT
ncbi:MAG: GGDEF domain-containing protein [Marinobacter sp.]|uniref:GGDEF domain-containing protein n=1 Tax=Marinobacter sp. TaxID=50741 RepID=UPI00299D67FA|nr:GGDEF domain-containing protein [Marinobacter sp.]MDX1636130.1 GGDEF domain-containing protein [Marinobacter sp.]